MRKKRYSRELSHSVLCCSLLVEVRMVGLLLLSAKAGLSFSVVSSAKKVVVIETLVSWLTSFHSCCTVNNFHIRSSTGNLRSHMMIRILWKRFKYKGWRKMIETVIFYVIIFRIPRAAKFWWQLDENFTHYFKTFPVLSYKGVSSKNFVIFL